MLIQKRFQLSDWNDDIKDKIIGYWIGRGFQFSQTSGNTMIGGRGSLFWNTVSFNMARLRTRLKVEITEGQECIASLDVSTAFQIISSWNKAFWRLELDTFESVVLRDEWLQEDWAKYARRARIGDTLVVILGSLAVGIVVVLGFILAALGILHR